MALQEVTFPIVFSGGVDTKTDSKSVVPAKLIALENAVFEKGTTIVKRTGYEGLGRTIDTAGGGTVYATPKAIAGRGAELVLFADDHAYSYRESSGTWSDAGVATSIVHTERMVCGTSKAQRLPDQASSGGVMVVAWEEVTSDATAPDEVWWAVLEEDTGRVIRPAERAATGVRSPRVCAVGDVIHVYYADPTGHRIWVIVVNPSAYLATLTPTILLDSLSSTNPSYDAMLAASGDRVLLSWADVTAGYWIANVHPSGVLGSALTSLPGPIRWADTLVGPVAVVEAPTATTPFVGVAYGSTATARLRLVDDGDYSTSLTETAVISPVQPLRIAAVAGTNQGSALAANATDVWVWAESTPAGAFEAVPSVGELVYIGVTTDAGGGDQGGPVRGHTLVSRGFLDNGTPHVVVRHEVDFFPYAAVLRTYIADPSVSTTPEVTAVARLAVGSSASAEVALLGVGTHRHQISVTEGDDRVWTTMVVTRTLVNSDPAGGAQFQESSLQLVTLDFDHVDAFQTVEWGSDLIVAGAMPLRYDGDKVAELGFHTAPDPIVVAAVAGTGSLTPDGTYLYCANYEEVDAQGVIHPGPMSVPQSVLVISSLPTVQVTIPTYRLTSKRRVRIAVWRTEANDESEDPAFYRVSSLNPLGTGANGYALNDTTVDSVTFTDEMGDAALVLQERAYINGGVLSNDPIGLGHIIAAGKDRIFWSDPTDPSVVRYSQTRRDGYGPEVPSDLSIRFDGVGGDITALGILDDALLAYKQTAIDFVAGAGPLPNPEAAPQIGFSPPQRVTSDVGCTAPRSLATVSDRQLFQTARGIYQIDRSRQVAYVGHEVEAYNAQRITSADAFPGKTHVVFLTDSGVSLLYDYHHGQWSTFTNHEGKDAQVVGGVYHYVRANEADLRVFRANSGYLDGSASIRLYLETAWVKLMGYHQGLQKIWYALLLGAYRSSHVLEVKVATDYRPGWDAPFTIAVDADYDPAVYGSGSYGAGPYGGDSDSVYQQRIHVGAKCQAIRFAIGEVASPPPQGASFELTELLLTGGAMRRSQVFGAGRTQ